MEPSASDIESTSGVDSARPVEEAEKHIIESNDGSNETPPPPKYKIKDAIWAKDTTTPLLYEAYVRKMIYAPKSRQVNICSMNAPNDSSSPKSNFSDLKAALDVMVQGNEVVETWHYFVNYKGWKNNWDRW